MMFEKIFPKVHPEGYKFLIISLIITLILLSISSFFGLVFIFISIWVYYFFRDPDRVIIDDQNYLVSPADGRISSISEVKGPIELGLDGKQFTKVSIFMNVFDCHVNRSPSNGEIEEIFYKPGKFLNASLDKASEENERNYFKIKDETTNENIVIVQIAGLIARRIVTQVQKTQKVKQGERLGMIRFGSRVDIYFSKRNTMVKVGQNVIAGESLIARKYMNKKKFKIVSVNKTRYILPSVLTLVGVCLGISSIKFALDGNFTFAVLFLVVAAILDALDGRVARLIKGTSNFGKELDSLTDFVSFGIAPAFIIYFWELNKFGKVGWLIVLFYSVCCVLRLARFNLTKFENKEEWKNNFFQGVPSPAGGCLILLPLIFELSNFSNLINIKIITPYLVVIISLLLISKLPTYSFKKISIKRNMTIFLLLGVGLFFVSIIQFTFETLFLGLLIYLVLIPIGILNFNKKSKSVINQQDEEDQQDVL